MTGTAPDLQRLLTPRSVAVVGASGNMESISGRPLKLLQRYGFDGAIYPVNPGRETVGGLTCYPDVNSLPETPDVAVLGVRAALTPGVLEQCAGRGVPFAMIFASAFAETEDQSGQQGLLDIARSGGMRLLGPNCQGLVNFARNVPLSFSASLDTDARPSGRVAYVSQSGAFGFASFAMAADQGVGFRYVVTTGNQADLDVVDFGAFFASDPEVGLLVMYMEGVSDGDRFVELLKTAWKWDLPVAVLKAGKSPTGQAAARSHTAALTGDEAVWRTIFRQYGVMEIEDVEDIVDLGRVFGASRKKAGRNLGILTTSGGAGIIMADRAWDLGLKVPELSGAEREKIELYLPSFGSSLNPVDMTAQVINDPEGFESCLETVLGSPGIDMAAVIVSMITGDSGRRMARDLAGVNQRSGKFLACCWLINEEQGGENLAVLRKSGVPLFQSTRRCARALSALAGFDGRGSLRSEPPLPEREQVLPTMPDDLTEYDAKILLDAWGVPVTRERLCGSLQECLAAAEEIGYPVALKVMSPDILHKTEAGIVVLDLKSPEEVRNGYGRLLERAGSDARVRGVLIQEMAADGMECMVGVRRDSVFGPMIAVGLGGIYVEVLGDVSLRRAPVDVETAMDMVSELRGFPLLAGIRGGRGRDVRALARAVSDISVMACAEVSLEELDVNPLFVHGEGYGVKVVDAAAIRRTDL